MPANLNNVLYLFTFSIIVSEMVCFPGHIPVINLLPNGLNYFTHRLNFIHPGYGIRKILIPEMNEAKQNHLRPNEGQHLPSFEPYTGRNIVELNLNTSKGNENVTSNNFTRAPNNETNIQNKEVDEKWNLFLDQYFKNQTINPEINTITTDRNTEIYTITDDILKENNTEILGEKSEVTYSIDTTDTTPYDNETTTDDDLLRNGVPPEVLSSLLG